MDASFKIIVKTLSGLEEVLANELREIGAEEVEVSRRAVLCKGDLETIYKINMRCRTALKVLKPIHEFKADTTDKVYHAVRALDWEEHMDLGQTFAIDAVTFSDKFHHSKFVALRTKDAIADFFSKKYNKRPNVSVTNPDIMINLHIADDNCTLSLDSSGDSLHKRGWRVAQTEAPINEVLAAGILLMAGWKGQSDLYDPMCGSGTFLIEAAMIAKGIAPGLYRNGFAFERWKNFDSELFEQIYNDESIEKDFEYRIYGSDQSSVALEIAERNIKNAGLGKTIELKNTSFQDLEVTSENAMFVMNPPYGDRLNPELLLELYQKIGDRLKHDFTGKTAWLISHKQECFNEIGLRPSQKINLLNGKLKCQLRQYETYEGSKKGEYQEKPEQENTEPREKPVVVKREDKPQDRRPMDRKPMDRKPRFDQKPSFGDRDRGNRPGGDRPFNGRPDRPGRPGNSAPGNDDGVEKRRKPSKKSDIERLRRELGHSAPSGRKDGKPKRPRIK